MDPLPTSVSGGTNPRRTTTPGEIRDRDRSPSAQPHRIFANLHLIADRTARLVPHFVEFSRLGRPTLSAVFPSDFRIRPTSAAMTQNRIGQLMNLLALVQVETFADDPAAADSHPARSMTSGH